MGLRVIEVVSIPVSDVDRAKAFYADTLGFTLAIDNPIGEDMRWVQRLRRVAAPASRLSPGTRMSSPLGRSKNSF